jgi:hypothetical protein
VGKDIDGFRHGHSFKNSERRPHGDAGLRSGNAEQSTNRQEVTQASAVGRQRASGDGSDEGPKASQVHVRLAMVAGMEAKILGLPEARCQTAAAPSPHGHAKVTTVRRPGCKLNPHPRWRRLLLRLGAPADDRLFQPGAQWIPRSNTLKESYA